MRYLLLTLCLAACHPEFEPLPDDAPDAGNVAPLKPVDAGRLPEWQRCVAECPAGARCYVTADDTCVVVR